MSPIELFQRDIDGRIKAAAYFADKPCFIYRPREKETYTSIDTRVNNALLGRLKQGGKSGIAICVFMPVAEIPDADPYDATFEVTGVVRIAENTLLNMASGGTKQSAEEVGLHVVLLMRNFYAAGLYNVVGCHNTDTLKPVGTMEEDDNILLYDLKFTTRFAVTYQRKMSPPTITIADDTVTIAPSALPAIQPEAIYYTLDFSYPRPSLAEELAAATNPNTSQLYTAPFALPGGGTVRAACYATAYQPSDVAIAQSLAFTTEQGDTLTTESGVVLTTE